MAQGHASSAKAGPGAGVLEETTTSPFQTLFGGTPPKKQCKHACFTVWVVQRVFLGWSNWQAWCLSVFFVGFRVPCIFVAFYYC